jgi:hypothetical protein
MALAQYHASAPPSRLNRRAGKGHDRRRVTYLPEAGDAQTAWI